MTRPPRTKLSLGGIRPIKPQIVDGKAIDRLNRKINRNIGTPYTGSRFLCVPSPSSEFMFPEIYNQIDKDGMASTSNCWGYSVGAIRNIYYNSYVDKPQPGEISKIVEPYAFVSCDDKVVTDPKGRKQTVRGPAKRMMEDSLFSQRLFGLPSPPLKLLYAPNVKRPDRNDPSLMSALSTPGTPGFSKSILLVDEPTKENLMGAESDYHFMRLTLFANPWSLLGVPESSTNISAAQRAYSRITTALQSNNIDNIPKQLKGFFRTHGVDRAISQLRQALSLTTQHASQVGALYAEKRKRFARGRFGDWDAFDCLPLWSHKAGWSTVLKTDANGLLINDPLAANMKFPNSSNNYRQICAVFEVQLGKMCLGEVMGTVSKAMFDAGNK
jgi:hypothetical protein